MKSPTFSGVLRLSAAATAILFSTAGPSSGKPGGVYNGTATGNVLKAVGTPPIPFNATPVKLRFPNGKGRVTGTLFTSRINHPTPPPVNINISGRVRKAMARQGGNKHILIGKWTWNFIPLSAPSKATGPFRIVIKKAGNGYKFKPAERVRVNGPAAGGGPAYVFRSKINAKR